MKLLVVFVLAVLGCSLAEGSIVTKCDLRDQLTKTVGNLTLMRRNHVLSGQNLVARLVCYADLSSSFNTSAVKDLPAGMLDKEHTAQGKPYCFEAMQNNPSMQMRTPPQPWVLYGIFQLPNRLACNDSINPTANICETPCSSFIDDDISDDITCLMSLFSNMGAGSMRTDQLMRMIHHILRKECRKVQPTDYFAGCPPPPN